MRNLSDCGRTLCKAGAALFAALMCCTVSAQPAEDYAVQLQAAVNENPAAITLAWQVDTNATSYIVSRKALGETSWSAVATLDKSALTWTDRNVTVGSAFEYQVVKLSSLALTGYGYIFAGIRRPVIEYRGRMILLVESSLAASLQFELARLAQDLQGDGWLVIRHDVSASDSVTRVKELILADYRNVSDETKGVFLFGHIPVPYSGYLDPDMHPDHTGAWPADVYYGDMDGAWTDSQDFDDVVYPGNSNKAGDGRFDQNAPPGKVRLQVGRVDLSNMTCFANKTPPRSELDLMRQYLSKDHAWRHGRFHVERRAVYFDKQFRGAEPEPQICTALRNYPGLVGRNNIHRVGNYDYFPTLATNSYLWSSVVSGGSAYGSDYVGSSDTWAIETPQVVFTTWMGSYFGDWNVESDFLRAPLGASGTALTSVYAGQPQWIFHPMSLGEPIGVAAQITQNNAPGGLYPPHVNPGAGQVHIALMGDPSLRMHPVAPPQSFGATRDALGVYLTWAASADPDVAGYFVYKKQGKKFARISGDQPTISRSFTDPSGTADDVYMVRAMKLEQTPSGSYYNLSQGMFFPDTLNQSTTPAPPTTVGVSSIVKGGVIVRWTEQSSNARGFEVQRRFVPNGVFTTVGQTSGDVTVLTDSISSAGQYAYRVKALGFAGDSDFSSEAIINLLAPTSSLVQIDTNNAAIWSPSYGNDGYVMFFVKTNLPGYLSLSYENAGGGVYQYNSTNPATLLPPDGAKRTLAFAYNAELGPMVMKLRFSDSAVHQVAFYMVDLGAQSRAGRVQVTDPLRGTIFQSLSCSNYWGGEYLVFNLQNYADVSFDPNMLVSAIFFDPLPPPPPTASFVGIDAGTQGDWKTKYGSLGITVPQWINTLPSGAQVNVVNASPWTWDAFTADVRGLNRYDGGRSRVATCWYGPDKCVLKAALDYKATRQVALYLLDWDASGRVEDIIVSDAFGNVLLQQRVDNFAGGKYLVFKTTGPVTITAKNIAGPNAVISGVFVDNVAAAADPPPPPTPPHLAMALQGGGYAIRFDGQEGQIYTVQRSTDFRTWTDVGQFTFSASANSFQAPVSGSEGLAAFRAIANQ